VVDKQQRIEMIGKVFVVTCGIRRCLICDREFTRREAAYHATTPCYPPMKESDQRAAYTDPCSPSLSLIESSFSLGLA
jgi:hypothetical protein